MDRDHVVDADEMSLVETLVYLADTLVRGFDVLDLFFHLVEHAPLVVNADEAGLLLVDGTGDLQVMAVSSDRVRLVELLQLHRQEGPCWDAYTSGTQVASSMKDPLAQDRWPSFVEAAQGLGFDAVTAVPMRLRDMVIGTLNLFSQGTKPLQARDLMAAQALADIATIAILQHRAAEDSTLLVAQLQTALTSRVKIEQAKGVIAEKLGVGMEEAFARLRHFARNSNRSIVRSAEAIVAGELEPTMLGGTLNGPI